MEKIKDMFIAASIGYFLYQKLNGSQAIKAVKGKPSQLIIDYPNTYTASEMERSESHFVRDSLLDSEILEFAMTFYPPEIEKVHLVFVLGQSIVGHPGITHGGLIAALFDEAIGILAHRYLKKPAFTAYIKVDFKQKVPYKSYVKITVSVDQHQGRKLYLKADLTEFTNGQSIEADGELLATAEALFVVPKEIQL
jgi:acyl-coenzyme A thioesterase PaaI-like protein